MTDQPQQKFERADVMSILLGLLLAMLLGALDQTIVATAMPTIGRELGDIEQLPWIVTAYLLASVAVSEGQEVKAGEALAVVEAMKMENVLRAVRDGTIKTLHAKAGDSLRVDQKIIEFA